MFGFKHTYYQYFLQLTGQLILGSQLRLRLKKAKRKVQLPKFPSGKMFGADKESFVKKRKENLQVYITELLKIPEAMKTGILSGDLNPRYIPSYCA